MKTALKSLIAQLSIPLAILAVTLLALTPLPANAASKSSHKTSDGFYKGTIIKAVNLSTSTIEIETMENQEKHTYKIDSITAIVIAGSPGKISGLKFGQQVLDLVERDNETLDAITVDKADKWVKK